MNKKFIYLCLLLGTIGYANAGKSPWTGGSVPNSSTGQPASSNNSTTYVPPTQPTGNAPIYQNQMGGFNPNGANVLAPGANGNLEGMQEIPEIIEVPVRVLGKVNGKTLYKSTDGKTYLVQTSSDKKVIRTRKVESYGSIEGQGAGQGQNNGTRPPDLPNSVGNVPIRH